MVDKFGNLPAKILSYTRTNELIKGVIFDLGSTLIKLSGDWPDVVREGAEATAEWYYKQKHVKVDREGLVETFIEERRLALQQAAETLEEAQMTEVLRRALKRINASARAEAMVEEALRCFFAPEEAAHTPFPDAVETLKTLRAKNLKVGILSNAPDDSLIQRLVNDNGLRPWVSPVFSSAGLGWRKPSPEPFALIAQRWGIPANQIVVVGDTLATDILGAKNAGMRSIHAAMVENPANELYHYLRPDRTVTVLSQVPLVIEEM
jgi:HAD superfamily hydrolase (TIGR01549 family)